MDIEELKKLAGVGQKGYWQEVNLENISVTGTEKRRIEKEKGIEPGTEEWFKLWFSLPGMTGKPATFQGRKKK